MGSRWSDEYTVCLETFVYTNFFFKCTKYKIVYFPINFYNIYVYISFCIFHKFLYFRPYWRCYYSNTDAIIYVVDSADRDRIGISKDELILMLQVSNFYE